MRQQKEIEKKVITKKGELTDEQVLFLGKFLDSKHGLHIENVYFTESGDYFYNVHRVKNDLYSRLEVEEKFIPELNQTKLARTPKPEHKIVNTIPADKIVDMYLKLKNKK